MQFRGSTLYKVQSMGTSDRTKRTNVFQIFEVEIKNKINRDISNCIHKLVISKQIILSDMQHTFQCSEDKMTAHFVPDYYVL